MTTRSKVARSKVDVVKGNGVKKAGAKEAGTKRTGAKKSGAKKTGATKPAPKRPASANRRSGTAAPELWDLRLYVAGQSAKSAAAIANLSRICEEHLAGRYRIEVVDLVKNPQLASGDQIVAIPTLVRKLPSPMKRIIGDLSNAERSIVGLDLRPRP